MSTAGVFLRNAWYVAAWSREVTGGLFTRKILDEDVLIYRDDDDRAIAIGNRCPHRFAPLHLGRKIGATVQCGYHGLRFDATGACVLNPNGAGKIPATARVPAYPLEERHDLLWIWMGDRQAADPAGIPDFSCLTDDAQFTSATDNYLYIRANYQLLCDNLMDLTHAAYLHAGSLGSDAISRGELSVSQQGATINSDLFVPNFAAPPALRCFIESGEDPVDHWLDMRWDPGCSLRLDVGITRPGKSREEGGRTLATHIVTPETPTTTHYFYGSSRTYDRASADATEAARQRQKAAFENEDEPMIVAVQRMMETSDLFSLHPAILATDAGAIRVRRYLDGLIAAEQPQ